jgi:hypothetical protein
MTQRIERPDMPPLQPPDSLHLQAAEGVWPNKSSLGAESFGFSAWYYRLTPLASGHALEKNARFGDGAD